MDGIVLRVNDELFVIAGEVIGLIDRGSEYIITLKYEEYNNRVNHVMNTCIVFRNQGPRYDGKKPIPFADRVKRMNLKVGSIIITTVRFRDGKRQEANGYTCRYNGIISFPPDESHKTERNIIAGMVIWMYDKINSKSNCYVSLGLYIGRDQYGRTQTITINVTDEKLMLRCKKILAPREDGRKKNAVFRCSEAFITVNDAGEEHAIYHAFDFRVIGNGNYKKR